MGTTGILVCLNSSGSNKSHKCIMNVNCNRIISCMYLRKLMKAAEFSSTVVWVNGIPSVQSLLCDRVKVTINITSYHDEFMVLCRQVEVRQLVIRMRAAFKPLGRNFACLQKGIAVSVNILFIIAHVSANKSAISLYLMHTQS